MNPILQNQCPANVNISMRQNRPGRSALKWLILLGFMCSQFAYAGHQLSHGAEDPGEVCQICASFDRNDDALTEPALETPLTPNNNEKFAVLAGRSIVDPLPIYNARASPKLLK